MVSFDAKRTYGEEVDPERLRLAWNGFQLSVRYGVSGRPGWISHLRYQFGGDRFYDDLSEIPPPGEILLREFGGWEGIFPRLLPGTSSPEEAELFLESVGEGDRT